MGSFLRAEDLWHLVQDEDQSFLALEAFQALTQA